MVKKRENGEGTVYFDKQRNKYRAAITDPYGQRLFKRFNTREEAKDWLTDIRSQFARDTYVAPNDMTISDWIIEWIKTYKANLRPKSKLQYLQSFSHIEPIADMPLQAKSANLTVQRFLNGLPDTMASSSKYKIYQLLSAAVKKAYMLGIINKNFMDLVEPPKVTHEEVEIFTQAEIKKILDYLQNPTTTSRLRRHYAFILLAATTGARLGELLSLRWKNVDTKENTIKIVSTLQALPGRPPEDMPTKTAAGRRYITIPERVTAALLALKKSGKILYMDKQDYVFRTRAGTPFLPSNMRRAWSVILKGAEVNYKKFHCLRHTHATQLLSGGVPLLEVCKRLGHSKPSHTLNLYGHAIPNMDKMVAEQVAKIYEISG